MAEVRTLMSTGAGDLVREGDGRLVIRLLPLDLEGAEWLMGELHPGDGFTRDLSILVARGREEEGSDEPAVCACPSPYAKEEAPLAELCPVHGEEGGS